MSKITTATRRPWHVNAVKDGRCVGDETAEKWDKLFIHSSNCTIAQVYRPKDARFITTAANHFDDMLELLQAIRKKLTIRYGGGMSDDEPILAAIDHVLEEIEGESDE